MSEAHCELYLDFLFLYCILQVAKEGSMSGLKKIMLELESARYDELQRLSEMLGHDTKAKTINLGLSLLKWAPTAVQQGQDIGSLNPLSDELAVLDMDFIKHLRGKTN
jgi:hypothetical protein